LANGDTEVAIVGGGAAGVAAARRLHDAGVDCLIVEARSRLGGRAWTMFAPSGDAIDLGCGWLHSADRNPWVTIAQAQGRTIDKTAPPWSRPALSLGFPENEQTEFNAAFRAFHDRLDAVAIGGADRAADTSLEPGSRWNGLINALGTFISGAETDRLSTVDFTRYDDSGVNWRLIEGYGMTVASYGADIPMMLDCPVTRIDRSGAKLRIETAKGAIKADRVIVTLPTSILAENENLFSPALPDKTEAAHGLPLGLADKLFMALEFADEFSADTHLFGHTDRAATAAYNFRPFGRPQIEAYFGGRLARELEAGGERAFFDFASEELARLLGSGFTRRLKPIHIHRWGTDRFAGGSYSYALPGKADCRAALAAPVDDRLFFAGEACSKHYFSTAHGGFLTGVSAADKIVALRQPRAAG
jgi:monoamine oxidase